MKILVTGSSGLIGSALCDALTKADHSVQKLTRTAVPGAPNTPFWDIMPQDDSSAANAIIHLAGENIAAKRWSAKQKQKIYDSRILGTRNLVQQIIASPDKPQIFMCASAIGFYGDRGKEHLTEDSEPGDNFAAKLSQDWEQETLPLLAHGIRVVNLRFGVILARHGGALKKMLSPFKLGLGGPIGKGQQIFSWICIDDAINAIIHVLNASKISGPVNISAPNPVSNQVFTKQLAKQLNRPAFFVMPAPLCRLAFGEMADELLLASQNVIPQKLVECGFTFAYSDIKKALNKVLG